jgi:arylsulfatase
MKQLVSLWVVLVGILFLGACTESPSGGAAPAASESSDKTGIVMVDGKKKKRIEGFGGIISERYDDSEEWWPDYEEPNEDAPNVIIFLLDDVGFAQVGSFGGLIETPNIDQLASNGLRFNNFHTTALCSPSRASLMAGRFPHSIGLGSHALTAMGFPGYNAVMPESAKSVANYLGEAGYVNYALGKWDHTPLYEVSQVGPFDRWPSGEGFHHAYTFMAADVHQFVPVMWNDHTPEPYRKSVHLCIRRTMRPTATSTSTRASSIWGGTLLVNRSSSNKLSKGWCRKVRS